MTGSGRRALGFGALLTLGINGIVGVGIFFAPSESAILLGILLAGWLLLWLRGLLAPAPSAR